MVIIRFERSEICAESHNSDPNEQVRVAYDTTDGPWVQLTYNSLRSQDGRVVAELDDECGCWYVKGHDNPFSDVIVLIEGGS